MMGRYLLEDVVVGCGIMQISCPHACVVLSKKHLSIKDYVSRYYLNKSLSLIYKDVIHPLADPRGWQMSDRICKLHKRRSTF